MGKQNEKLLKMMKEYDQKQLPKWFKGEIYKEGAEVTNRFGGDSCHLNNVELSMYDFIMGATTLMEMGMHQQRTIVDLRKGLDWFRQNNSKAYMVLLD